MKRIIYKTQAGGISIIIPAPECLEKLSIEAIAMKDVPFGVPYKIIDTTDLPADRTFRAAWEADFTNSDGNGANYGAGSLNAVINITDEYVATLPIDEESGNFRVDAGSPISIFVDGTLVRKVFIDEEVVNDNR